MILLRMLTLSLGSFKGGQIYLLMRLTGLGIRLRRTGPSNGPNLKSPYDGVSKSIVRSVVSMTVED